MTMYISKRFPSLVEAVLARQRREEFKRLSKTDFPSSPPPPKEKRRFPRGSKFNQTPPISDCYTGIVKVGDATVGYAPRTTHDRLPRPKPTPLPKRPIQVKEENKSFCTECRKRVPYELHKAGCSFIGR